MLSEFQYTYSTLTTLINYSSHSLLARMPPIRTNTPPKKQSTNASASRPDSNLSITRNHMNTSKATNISATKLEVAAADDSPRYRPV